VLGVERDDGAVTGGAAHEREGLRATRDASHRVEHGGAPGPHELGDLLGRLDHDKARAGREHDDGVRVGLDGEDQVRVQVERLGRAPEFVKSDHGENVETDGLLVWSSATSAGS
jgi:hypothetical protein